jgi:hypothetical protein
MKTAARLLAYSLPLLFGAALPQTHAVILFRSGDPAENTTAPGRSLTDSGWQYQGQFGSFLGTPIAPQFFLTATHIGGAVGSAITFQGVNYTVTRKFADPKSDLSIWQVTGTFPFFAPLYTKSEEIGHQLVAIGRGTQRGSAIFVEGNLRGWNWGNADGVQRWGENVVSGIVFFGVDNDALAATFDADELPNESHLSSGDSGGALFLNDGAVWKLAGIHYDVDPPFYLDAAGNGAFIAALFDARGFYVSDGQSPPTYTLVEGPDPVPSRFYSTRVSSKLDWIYSVIDPSGDPDGDKISNLLEYAFHSDPLKPDAADAPRVGREGSFLTLTYRKVTTATDINYAVEQSINAVSWTPANAQNEIVSTVGNVQTIKAKVAIGSATRLVLRLRVTRP